MKRSRNNDREKWKCRYFLMLIATLFLIPPSIAGQTAGRDGYLQPDLEGVKLWAYNADRSRANYDYFWTATDPSKYVIPNNAIIRYYADNSDEIQLEYAPDPVDYWQNPDYTLKIMKGDCEDLSMVWVSVHRAMGHKAIVVGGYLYLDDGTSIRDFWYEYADGDIHLTKFVAPVTKTRRFSARPLFMFNDRMSLRDYDPNWMKK